jgi:hypothetical protein
MKYIISGYKGIMDLDLTHIDPKYHAEMIALHKKDIKEYKKEQSKLHFKQRYDYAIDRVLKQIERDSKLIASYLKKNGLF